MKNSSYNTCVTLNDIKAIMLNNTNGITDKNCPLLKLHQNNTTYFAVKIGNNYNKGQACYVVVNTTYNEFNLPIKKYQSFTSLKDAKIAYKKHLCNTNNGSSKIIKVTLNTYQIILDKIIIIVNNFIKYLISSFWNKVFFLIFR